MKAETITGHKTILLSCCMLMTLLVTDDRSQSQHRTLTVKYPVRSLDTIGMTPYVTRTRYEFHDQFTRKGRDESWSCGRAHHSLSFFPAPPYHTVQVRITTVDYIIQCTHHRIIDLSHPRYIQVINCNYIYLVYLIRLDALVPFSHCRFAPPFSLAREYRYR